MNETEFHALADKTLDRLYDAFEALDENGTVEMEYEAGVMTIAFKNGRQYVLSKHAPTRQIWLSSPVSGGLHFAYDPPPLEGGVRGGAFSESPPTPALPLKGGGSWMLADGRTLAGVLAEECKSLGIEVGI